jgi:hypothetical protein
MRGSSPRMTMRGVERWALSTVHITNRSNVHSNQKALMDIRKALMDY